MIGDRTADGGGYIAVDWGTSNRRAFLIDPQGRVRDTLRDAAGVLSLAPSDYPREIERLRARFGVRRVIAAGMVGSTRGWQDIGYVAAPAGPASLSRAMVEVAPDVVVVPGLSLTANGRFDVMRGEEVQVLGAVAAGLAPADATFAQPGTHNKWVRVEAGQIVDFRTAMTGELFALLRRGGVLAGMLDGPVAPNDAFAAGVDRGAGAADLTSALFEVRARVLLGALDPVDAASYASGVLIGADVGSPDRRLDASPIFVIGSGDLGALYITAIARRGGTAHAIDAEAAFVAGIHALEKVRG